MCEDEKIFKDEFESLIKHYFKTNRLLYRLDGYENGEQLLEVNHQQYDILYLDVGIKDGIDGITLAKKLRMEDNKGQIIFLTSHQADAYKAFEVNAFRYLLKPLNENVLHKTMDLVIKKIEEIKKNYIVLQVGQSFIKLQLQEILHIETYKRKLKVYTSQKEYLVDCTLSEVENELRDRGFFRTHKSFLINLEHVKEHNNNTAVMQSEIFIPISRLKLSTFKEEFIAYLKGKKDGGID